MIRSYFLCLAGVAWLVCCPGSSMAQLIVVNGTDPVALAQKLVGSGVAISNVTINCPSGAWGFFDGVNTNLGIDSGVALASGALTNMIGPNNQTGVTTNYNAPGDPDLDLLSTYPTHDACVLEFDVFVTGDTLKFNYVFGSDEYSEWVNSAFNDIFAFLISGPGIVGQKNIALVPGTSNPVAINTVNCLNGSVYYVCNEPSNTLCPPSYNCNGPGKGVTLQYDGFTKVLQAVVAVIPCETYHLKLAVADASDQILDSGVWIEAGSLSSSGADIDVLAPYVDPGSAQSGVVEGCFDGSFVFSIAAPASDTITLHLTLGGTATEGVDYTLLPDSIQILPGQQTVNLNFSAFSDALSEGFETVVMYLYLACDPDPYDSAVMYIFDEFAIEAGPDTSICIGQSVTLTATEVSFATYQWLPVTNLDCPTCSTTLAIPQGTTNYVVSVTLGNCTATDTATVFVDIPLPVYAGPDVEICIGQSIQLQAQNASSYQWAPAEGLSCTDCPNPIASPTATTTYTVTGINACGVTTDEITITVHPSPVAIASEDQTICPGDTVLLTAGGGVSYSWSPQQYCLSPNNQSTLVTTWFTTTFTVLVTNQFGCTDDEDVIVNVYDIPLVSVSNDTTIYLGNSVDLWAMGGVSYLWYPSTYLTDPFSANPTSVQPSDTIKYYVVVTSAEGCKSIDSVLINVRWDALVMLPSAFSPNNDGKNDYFKPLVRGVFYLDYFRVYNRWGELVYEMRDLNLNGWDGSYKGTVQPVGVYVYLLKGSDHSGRVVERSGNVSLIR